ncbi:hypothetical protein PF007_g26131 [Phytophthora fragariae]|uniref:Uncharacterized protein n=1 Tax=Phytophthora fragariae TaxID=53985 RepID=A0A6A3QAV3_9STRA|nr:hypothetical protein PF007_g26131 [Phytophthora fragariae]KAE9180570.1 hypothetical protein PF004_g24802 [Phytophthora fragariae]
MVDLRARLALYSGGGVKGNIGTAEWLKHHEAVIAEVRNDLLLLPPATVTGKKRKLTTVDVAGRLVTKERLLAGAYEYVKSSAPKSMQHTGGLPTRDPLRLVQI